MLFGSSCSYEGKQSLQKKIVAHSHSEFFLAMLSILKTENQFIIIKLEELSIKKSNLKLKFQHEKAKTVLANPSLLMTFKCYKTYRLHEVYDYGKGGKQNLSQTLSLCTCKKKKFKRVNELFPGL